MVNKIKAFIGLFFLLICVTISNDQNAKLSVNEPSQFDHYRRLSEELVDEAMIDAQIDENLKNIPELRDN